MRKKFLILIISLICLIPSMVYASGDCTSWVLLRPAVINDGKLEAPEIASDYHEITHSDLKRPFSAATYYWVALKCGSNQYRWIAFTKSDYENEVITKDADGKNIINPDFQAKMSDDKEIMKLYKSKLSGRGSTSWYPISDSEFTNARYIGARFSAYLDVCPFVDYDSFKNRDNNDIMHCWSGSSEREKFTFCKVDIETGTCPDIEGTPLEDSGKYKDIVSCRDADYKYIKECGCMPASLTDLTSRLYMLIKIAAPALLLVIGGFDLIKAMSAQDESAINKARQKLVKKFIAAAAVFLIFTLIQFLVSTFANNVSDTMKCLDYILNGYVA